MKISDKIMSGFSAGTKTDGKDTGKQVAKNAFIGLDVIEFEKAYNHTFPSFIGTLIDDIRVEFNDVIFNISQHMAAPVAKEKADEWVYEMNLFLYKTCNEFVVVFQKLRTAGLDWAQSTGKPISAPSKDDFIKEKYSHSKIINVVRENINGVQGVDLEYFQKDLASLILSDKFGIKDKINKLIAATDGLGFVGGSQTQSIKYSLQTILKGRNNLQNELLERIAKESKTIATLFGDTAGKIQHEFQGLSDIGE